MDDSIIICDKVINSCHEKLNFNEKKIFKTYLYILFAFLWITIALLIAVSISVYLIKYRGKLLLPFHNKSNKLNRLYIDILNWKWVIQLKIQIKKQPYYFFDDIININVFDTSNIKIAEKSY